MDNEKLFDFFTTKDRKFFWQKSLLYLGSSVLLFIVLYMMQSYDYLFFHSIAEMISVFSSLLIFVIVLSVWEDLEDNNYLSFLGIAFFFVGIIDILHMVTYRGMNIIHGFDADLPTQLWIVARYIQSISLLIGTSLITRKEQVNKYMVFSIYTSITVILLSMIFYWGIFPECFIEGYGLTLFKKISEYIICIILIISAFIMQRHREFFSVEILRLLLFSLFFQILAELAFTTFISVYAFSNFLGHYFKIVSIILFSKAILITALTSPSTLLYKKIERLNLELEQRIEERTIELKEINAVLEEEVAERQKKEEMILKLNDGLEDRIKERTTESRLLQERLQKYQVLAEKANDAMLFIDKNGYILEANDAAIRIYGYTMQELLSMSIFDLRHGTRSGELLTQLEMADKEGIIFETDHYCKNGTVIHVEVSSKGTILGKQRVLLSIIRDITDRKKAQIAMSAALKKAEDANLAKGQFLANMSHEIRTPMNGIIGMIDLILMTDLQAQQREYMTIVKSSTISLLRVLNDILDYSKMEAGKIDLENKPFDLQNTICEVVELFHNAAKQKQLDLRYHFDQEIPRHVIGDAVRLRQVLSNLVGNGIKFTTQGYIALDVTVRERDHKQICVQFSIIDTGRGIPEDKLNKLFKRFSQVDDSNTRQFGGSGLGLAISKNLIELMGGTIGVESQEHVGSRFFFTAIFGLQEEVTVIHSEMVENNPMLQINESRKTVLLVEDDLVSRNMMSLFLEKKGFTVITAENGKEAIGAVEKEKFAVILMDINMPYLDGYSATIIIRSNQEGINYNTPIIAMTAYALQGDREKCLDVGMNDYISKPIDFSMVIAKLEKYLQ